MNQSDLANTLADRMNISKSAAKDYVKGVLDAISGALTSGDDVRLAGLGSFSIQSTKGGERRNPRTGEKFTVPDGKRVKFKPAKELKESL